MIVGVAADILAIGWLVDSNVLDLHYGGPDLVQSSVVNGSKVLRDTEVNEEVLRERRREKGGSAGEREERRKGRKQKSSTHHRLGRNDPRRDFRGSIRTESGLVDGPDRRISCCPGDIAVTGEKEGGGAKVSEVSNDQGTGTRRYSLSGLVLCETSGGKREGTDLSAKRRKRRTRGKRSDEPKP